VKLNEFQQINELDLSHVIGDYGSAGLKQIGNRLLGRPEGQLSVKDKMASDMFVRDFVGRAKTDLNAAIKSGLVDPNSTGAPVQTAPTQPSTQPAAPAQPTQPSATAPTTPAVQRPEEIRKAKQASAAGVVQKQMAANPAAKTAPLTPAQIRQQRLTTNAATAQKQMTPFSKVTPKPEEENPNIIKGTNESKFSKLNAVFEAMVDPAQSQAMSIAQYVKRMFTKYMKGVKINDPQVQRQLDTLAQEVQNSKGSSDSLTKLANLAYSVSYADSDGDGVPDTKQASAPSALDAISAGFKQGMGQPTGKEIDTVKEPQKAQTVYAQIKTLIPKMDKKGKQRIVAYLDKQLGVAPAAAPTGPNVMGNMVNQLAGNAPAATSSPTSVVNKASATNPNQAPKAVSRVAQARQKQAVKKAKIADAPYKPA
jgi:hypothetical protein